MLNKSQKKKKKKILKAALSQKQNVLGLYLK